MKLAIWGEISGELPKSTWCCGPEKKQNKNMAFFSHTFYTFEVCYSTMQKSTKNSPHAEIQADTVAINSP